jgi:hypothetical protein
MMALSQAAGNSGNAAFKVRPFEASKYPPGSLHSLQDKEKPMAVRAANIQAARGMLRIIGVVGK